MADYIKVRGMQDIYEYDAQVYQKIVTTGYELAKNYNYKYLQIPTIEQTSLYNRATGESSDIVKKEMYSFLDKGNRQISLRPEGTAGVIRLVVENKLYANYDLPLKYYYCGTFFRYERPQAGRYREFSQFGIELIGTNSYLDDAESILFAVDYFKKLNITNYTIRLNSFGNDTTRNKYRDVLKDYFMKFESDLCEDCKNRLATNPLRILDCKIDKEFFENKDIPKAIDYLDEESLSDFKKILKILDDNNVNYQIDNRLVRGLDYYTGFIFEFDLYDSENKVYTAGGGGRYNNLVSELNGPDLSCVGFAFGLDRIALVCKTNNLLNFTNEKKVYVMPLSENATNSALKVTTLLRANDYNVTMQNSKKSIGAMFKYASKNDFKYALIIGDDEISSNTYKVKNLITQEQVTLTEKDLLKYLKEEK